MEFKLALRVDDLDNVATVFANGITAGTEVEVRDKKGNIDKITVHSDIPYGHKIAVTDIAAGSHIMKYGESIGEAECDIRRGSDTLRLSSISTALLKSSVLRICERNGMFLSGDMSKSQPPPPL